MTGSDHILHVVIELSVWGNPEPDPIAALAHIKTDIEDHLTSKYAFDPIEDTGMTLEGVQVI